MKRRDTCDRDEEPVVRKEFKAGRFDVVRKSVKFYTIFVVDEYVFLLCDGKVGLIMQVPIYLQVNIGLGIELNDIERT